MGDLKLVERLQQYTLAPGASKVIRANIKVGAAQRWQWLCCRAACGQRGLRRWCMFWVGIAVSWRGAGPVKPDRRQQQPCHMR
jgi:hypothetical protein